MGDIPVGATVHRWLALTGVSAAAAGARSLARASGAPRLSHPRHAAAQLSAYGLTRFEHSCTFAAQADRNLETPSAQGLPTGRLVNCFWRTK